MPRAVVAVVTSLVALASVSGCSAMERFQPDTPQATKSAPAKPHLKKPTVGECHTLTVKAIQAASDTRPSVPCTATHTTRTVAVVKEPAAARKGSEDARAAAVGEACADGFKNVVGGTSRKRAETLFNLAWFTPTKAQRDKGARWMRCDVTMTGERRAYPITGKNPLLADGVKDRERLCGRLSPGEKVKWEFAPCASDHLFEPKKFIQAGSDVTIKEARAAAKKACNDGLYTWSPPAQWGVGDRWYVCWGPAEGALKDDDTIMARAAL
jgi:hypothetical protein